MADKPEVKQTRPRGQAEQDRQQRLNKALRENLLKRKQQSRSRQNLKTPAQEQAQELAQGLAQDTGK